jgi:hypothetical protein
LHNFEQLTSEQRVLNLKNKLLTKEKLQLDLFIKSDEDEDAEIKSIWDSF